MSLPGHSFNHIGIKVEGVLFCGDALFSKEVIEKHKVLFYVNIGEQKKTFERLREEKYKIIVPSHGRPLKEGDFLIKKNKEALVRVEGLLLELLKNWISVEGLLKEVFSKLEIKTNSVHGYFLIKATLMAYLSYFYEEGRIKWRLSEGVLLWSRT